MPQPSCRDQPGTKVSHFPRHCDPVGHLEAKKSDKSMRFFDRVIRGMDHVRLDPTRRKPPRQPEAVAAGFKGQRNPRDSAAGPDRLIPPAMQHGKQPFWAWLQLLARLTLNARKYAANQPARLAHLDDGNDRAILVQGDEGPAQVVRLGHRGTPSLDAATKLPFPRRPPHSICRSLSREC